MSTPSDSDNPPSDSSDVRSTEEEASDPLSDRETEGPSFPPAVPAASTGETTEEDEPEPPDTSVGASLSDTPEDADREDAVGTDDGPATLGELEEPQRLHPLTLLQRVLASLPAVALLLVPVVMNPSSQNVFYLFTTVVYGVIALPSILLQYYRFSYRLTEKQIIIQSGVFNRKNRSIPIERVQNVQIEQNLLARAATIAKVKIETAGSTGTEGVLEYVSLSEAHRIRQVIRSFQRDRMGRTTGALAEDSSVEDAAEGSLADTQEQVAEGPQPLQTNVEGDGGRPAHEEESPEAAGPEAEGIEGVGPEAARPPSRQSAYERSTYEPSTYEPSTYEPSTQSPTETSELFRMSLARVLLSGMFRFSLVYIAVVFSVFQFVEPDTLLNYVMASRSQVQAFFDTIYDSPFLAALVTIVFASFFGWLTGILINLTRYYNFHLWLDGDKLRKRHGLFTVTEGTIPIEKVQALIIRTNPFMEAFGWYALEAQTVGLDVNEQGHRVVVPFARLRDVLDIGRNVRSFDLPEAFKSVSPLTIRRSFVRYIVALSVAVAPAAYFYPADWWHPMEVALPWWSYTLTPLLLGWAYLQYRFHGYRLQNDGLYVRRGVIGRYIWVLPTEKQHVYYSTASVFQRRLGLKTVFVDTAGAAGFAYPEIVDVPENAADGTMNRLYEQFETLYQNRIRTTTGSANTRLTADERPQLPSQAPSQGAPSKKEHTEKAPAKEE